MCEDMELSVLDAWRPETALMQTLKAYKTDFKSTNSEVASAVDYMPFYHEKIIWHFTIWEEESCHHDQASNLFIIASSLHGNK